MAAKLGISPCIPNVSRLIMSSYEYQLSQAQIYASSVVWLVDFVGWGQVSN